MKRLKYLLIYLIILLAPTAFCAEFNLNSYISATYSGNRSKYECYETYQYGTLSHCSFGTRYNGRMGSLKIFIHYPFEEDTNYRLTFNMASDDFRNNFGSAWTWDCDNNTDITNMNSTVWTPTFISYKKAQLSFSLNDNTTCVGVLVRSANYSSDAFTGVNNWNLSNITIYDPDWQSGGSGQGSATPSPTTPDPNQQIIDNANQNTQDVIENNNSNTQQIIDNQNNLLTTKCTNLLGYNNYYRIENTVNVNVNGDTMFLSSNNTWAHIDYEIPTEIGKTYYVSGTANATSETALFWVGDTENNFENRYFIYENNGSFSGSFTATTNLTYVRLYASKTVANTSTYYKIMFSEKNSPYCVYGSSTSNKIDNINDSLTSDNVDSGTGSDFFSNFEDEDFGLSDIITIPLTIIQGLTSKTCTPLTIPIPFTNSTITLPCMTEIYQNKFPSIFNLWRIVSFGVIAYFIATDIFYLVKGFKDPESDKVEVLDL